MDYKKEYERYKSYSYDLEKENLALTMRLAECAKDKPVRWEQVMHFQAEKRLDMIKHFIDDAIKLKCCGNCEYWMYKYQKCEHPDQTVSEVDDYSKESTDKCDLWEWLSSMR